MFVELTEGKKEGDSRTPGWILKLQLLRDLPRKDAAPKVPIGSGVLIDGLLQVQIPDAEKERALASRGRMLAGLKSLQLTSR